MPTPIFSKNLSSTYSDSSVSDYLLDHHNAVSSSLGSNTALASTPGRYSALPLESGVLSLGSTTATIPSAIVAHDAPASVRRTKSESSSLNHDDELSLYDSLDEGLRLGEGAVLGKLVRSMRGFWNYFTGGYRTMSSKHANAPNRAPRILCRGILCILVVTFMIVFCIVALVFWVQYATRDKNKSTFLWFSDIHMEPFYNDTQSCYSLCRNVETYWASVPCGLYRFEKDVPKVYGRYGCNTPRELLKQTMQEMRAKTGQKHKLNFGIYTGDLAAHGIAEVIKSKNDRLALEAAEQELMREAADGTSHSQHHQYYDESLGARALQLQQVHDPHSLTFINATEVVRTTIENVIHDIREAFHDLPVFLTVGNCDVVHDYQWSADRQWIMELHKLFKKLWNGWQYVDDSDFVSSNTGNYVVTQLPGLPSMRLISFNSLLFAPQLVRTAEMKAIANWSLTWIEEQLLEAEEERQKVLLMYHIPVGMNAYSNAPQWFEEYEIKFLALAQRFKDTIESHLCGHFHYESFKLLTDEATQDPYGVLLVSPSVSPFFFNNPSFREFVIDSDRIVDYFNYFFDLEKQDESVQFVQQHEFQQAYQLPDLSLKSMLSLYETLWVKRDYYTLAQYIFRRRSQYMPKMPEYQCSMRHQKAQDVKDCVKKHNTGIVPDVPMW